MLFGLFFGLPGYAELLIVAFVALLLFGNRLPSVMRSLGRSVVEFKKGVSGIEDELDKVGHEPDDPGKPGAKQGEAEHGHSDAAPK
ncbi:MAG: twin-arginine translocase TatA/TatE family subunit [Pirellulales bacterium]|nr:twin-arginine translocase TatA/TatE family subunit [Pirellulales bacterium]